MEQNSLLDGLIFSDAYLRRDYINTSIHITQKIEHLEYLEYLSSILDINTFRRNIDRYDKRSKRFYEESILRSNVHPFLNDYRERWYTLKGKIIPRDLKITSTFLLHAYLGDGCLVHPKRGNARIVLSTNGFPIEDVEWFVKQMNKMGFSCVRDKHNNSTRFHVSATKLFLDFIGECPVKCFEYKWRIK